MLSTSLSNSYSNLYGRMWTYQQIQAKDNFNKFACLMENVTFHVIPAHLILKPQTLHLRLYIYILIHPWHSTLLHALWFLIMDFMVDSLFSLRMSLGYFRMCECVCIFSHVYPKRRMRILPYDKECRRYFCLKGKWLNGYSSMLDNEIFYGVLYFLRENNVWQNI